MGVLTTGAGATCIIMKQVEPGKVVDFVEQYRIKNMFLVPAVIQFVIALPGIEQREPHVAAARVLWRIRDLRSGAAPRQGRSRS